MKHIIYISALFFCLFCNTANAQDSTSKQNIHTDTLLKQSKQEAFTLLDTLLDLQQLRLLCMPYEKIGSKGNINVSYQLTVARKTPNLKQIKIRNSNNKQAYFFVILILVLLVSIARLTNPKNFSIFIQSVFDTQLGQRIWSDGKSNFLSVILQMSINFILTVSILIAFYLQSRSELLSLSFYSILWRTILILFAIYCIKFFILWLVGLLLNFSVLSQGFITNTISLNGFISLIMLPLSIVYIYNSGTFLGNATFYTLVAIFFIGVIFRNLQIFFLAIRALRFPIIYLFIYLCALEILPWLLLFKILDNYFV